MTKRFSREVQTPAPPLGGSVASGKGCVWLPLCKVGLRSLWATAVRPLEEHPGRGRQRAAGGETSLRPRARLCRRGQRARVLLPLHVLQRHQRLGLLVPLPLLPGERTWAGAGTGGGRPGTPGRAEGFRAGDPWTPPVCAMCAYIFGERAHRFHRVRSEGCDPTPSKILRTAACWARAKPMGRADGEGPPH